MLTSRCRCLLDVVCHELFVDCASFVVVGWRLRGVRWLLVCVVCCVRVVVGVCSLLLLLIVGSVGVRCSPSALLVVCRSVDWLLLVLD